MTQGRQILEVRVHNSLGERQLIREKECSEEDLHSNLRIQLQTRHSGWSAEGVRDLQEELL